LKGKKGFKELQGHLRDFLGADKYKRSLTPWENHP
jgi:hypothetical protein